jgi:hypothetical protein
MLHFSNEFNGRVWSKVRSSHEIRDMSPPKKTRGRSEPSYLHENVTPGPRELLELKTPDKINADDILHAMITASKGVATQSVDRCRDAKCLVENIVGTIDEMKN